MGSRAEIEDCIAEYLIGVGLKQIEKYAHSSAFGDPLSFQIDYSGRVWGRFVNRYFSLIPKPGEELKYIFTLHHTRFKEKLIKNDLANLNKNLAGQGVIDFYKADSFEEFIKTLMDSENNATAPMDWKHLVCLWLEDQGYSYLQERSSPIHVLSQDYSLEKIFDVYILNILAHNWYDSFKGYTTYGGKPPPEPDKETDIYVLDHKSQDRILRTRANKLGPGVNRPGEHPDSWRYHVGNLADPRFFTRLKLGMNKMRVKNDGAG